MKNSGFTLIELMIVVAILGVIAAIAVPSYQNHVLKAGRTAAMADAEAIAAAMARFRSQNFSYAGATLGAGGVFPRDHSPEGPAAAAKYTLLLEVNGNNAFTVTVIPKGQQSKDECGKLTLDNLGVRGAAKDSCW